MAAFCARQHYTGRTDPAVLVDRQHRRPQVQEHGT
jgi:hypothetical protein